MRNKEAFWDRPGDIRSGASPRWGCATRHDPQGRKQHFSQDSDRRAIPHVPPITNQIPQGDGIEHCRGQGLRAAMGKGIRRPRFPDRGPGYRGDPFPGRFYHEEHQLSSVFPIKRT